MPTPEPIRPQVRVREMVVEWKPNTYCNVLVESDGFIQLITEAEETTIIARVDIASKKIYFSQGWSVQPIG